MRRLEGNKVLCMCARTFGSSLATGDADKTRWHAVWKLSLFAAAWASGQKWVALSKDGSSSSVTGCGVGWSWLGADNSRASSHNSRSLPWPSFSMRMGSSVAIECVLGWFLCKRRWLSLRTFSKKARSLCCMLVVVVRRLGFRI